MGAASLFAPVVKPPPRGHAAAPREIVSPTNLLPDRRLLVHEPGKKFGENGRSLMAPLQGNPNAGGLRDRETHPPIPLSHFLGSTASRFGSLGLFQIYVGGGAGDPGRTFIVPKGAD